MENWNLGEYEQNEQNSQEPVNTFSTWFPIAAEWHYECDTDELNPTTYTVEKDTVVEGRVCRIIRGENGKSCDIVYEEKGCIYYYFNDAFRKIYDINVKEGDTVDFELKKVHIESVTTSVMPFRVNKVLSRVIDGVELKEVFAKSINEGIVHIYLERAGMELKSFPLGGIIPAYLAPELVTTCDQRTQLIRYSDSEINTEFRWVVRIKLKPNENHSYTVVQDAEIKALSLKHGVSLRRTVQNTDSSEWSLFYDLAGRNCNQDEAINDFWTTGKFEEDFFYEYKNAYLGYPLKGCD
jgi:hypothetical protein